MNNSNTISFYFNPYASGANISDVRNNLFKYFRRNEIKIKMPKSIEELKKELAIDKSQNTELIVISGGDGTINCMAQELLDSSMKIAIYPTGTANDFASQFKIKKCFKCLKESIVSGNFFESDIIKVNDQFMITNGGMGLTTEVALGVNRLREKYKWFKTFMKLVGSQVYSFILALKLLPRLKFREYVVKHDNGEGVYKASFIMVCNQPVIGGQFNVAPETKTGDGKFNISIFTHKKKSKLIKAILKLKAKDFWQNTDEELVHIESSKARIRSVDQKNIVFFGDGDHLVESNDLNFESMYRKLRILKS